MGPPDSEVATGREVPFICEENVLVTVTGFSVQDVCDRFPEPEGQIVEIEVMILVHTEG